MPIHIGARPDHDFEQPLGLLSDCHRRIEHFLDVLVAVERQRAGASLQASEHQALEGALRYFAVAAPTHTADEEESLFPRLRASGAPAAAGTAEIMARLERDHAAADHHQATIERLGRRWLDQGRLSKADAGELREHLAALQALYREHIGVEDRDLFPAAGQALSPAELAEVGREMAARRERPPRP